MFHNNKHCVKMILEYAQLLSTAHHILDETPSIDGLLKKTHDNHPSAIWVRQSIYNYFYLHQLLIDLAKEYTHRYNKTHLYAQNGLIEKLATPPENINKNQPFTEPTPAMPNDIKIYNDDGSINSIKSYKNYYILNKRHLAEWKNREMPLFYLLNDYSI